MSTELTLRGRTPLPVAVPRDGGTVDVRPPAPEAATMEPGTTFEPRDRVPRLDAEAEC